MADEAKELDLCERCGTEITIILAGDESFRSCPDCGTGIEQ